MFRQYVVTKKTRRDVELWVMFVALWELVTKPRPSMKAVSHSSSPKF